MKFKDLIGKTITEATVKQLAKSDDKGFLQLKFSDGSEAIIIACYESYTGNSEDEYPTCIYIKERINKELIDLK